MEFKVARKTKTLPQKFQAQEKKVKKVEAVMNDEQWAMSREVSFHFSLHSSWAMDSFAALGMTKTVFRMRAI